MVLPEIAILILPGCSEIKEKIICCLFDYLSIKIVCLALDLHFPLFD